ncbi:elongation of very long chain fatty acids protein 7 [Amyelois transitella]|uniref:elongation of very long chain fatty acids protein 7 n=1 Tax=Amyelois transitella TaxID=680683 RepID=UPI0029900D95|nr:elongation of very long chain fatty acids protein 7 [Amyelois transitella]
MDASEVILEEIQGNNYKIPTWSLADTLSWITIIIAIYLVSVKKALPEIMKNRPPYKLNRLLIWYNAFQVAYSVYLVFIYIRYICKHGIITTRCPQGNDLQEVINDIYPYFIAKHLDLLDTVFFVLRKKDNQITFLHLYHHTAMVSWTWLHLMHHPTDHFVVVGLLNSFVHVLMYAYYGISALGPEYAKYVWWKKHLTKVQLVQFILVVSDLYYQQKLTPCPIPGYFHWFCIISISSFFLLFMNFYFRSYKKKTKRDLEVPIKVTKSTLNVEFTCVNKNN